VVRNAPGRRNIALWQSHELNARPDTLVEFVPADDGVRKTLYARFSATR